MDFHDSLQVQAPIAAVWPFLKDIPSVVSCFPGASLTGVGEAGEYQGVVEARVGPFRTRFNGTATVVEIDDQARRLVLRAKASDPKLGSNATAMITLTASSPSPQTTAVAVHTDLQLLGRLAQFGRGILESVARQLTASFAQRLNERFTASAGSAPAVDPTGPAS